MITDAALLRLTTWLSPAFPVGAYTYSHGLEFAVEAGLVSDRSGLVDWIELVVRDGTGRIDAALFAVAWRAAARGDMPALKVATERCSAMRSTAEMALETAAQGSAFIHTVRTAWPHAWLDSWARELEAEGLVPSYPVAVAVAAAIAEIPLRPALSAYLNAFAANLVSAGIRLIPLGQTDGQIALERLQPMVLTAAEEALERPEDDWGGAALIVDWASMKHETQYTRLFRS